jgi:hypothetical protein
VVKAGKRKAVMGLASVCFIIILVCFIIADTQRVDSKVTLNLSDVEKELFKGHDLNALERQLTASAIYNRLINTFAPNGLCKADDYPDHYGGAFINGDGNLVVYLTDVSEANKKDISDKAESGDHPAFSFVKTTQPVTPAVN